MKKRFVFIIIFISMMFLKVNAVEHIPGELIVKGEASDINTETFKYEGITFSGTEEYGTINIKSVLNNTTKQIPMSINILLFDSNKVNVGFVSYCTEKDIESDYSNVKLGPNKSSSLSIKVSSKYFVEGKNSLDVEYYSLLDDNKHCQIGGYDKYGGKTIEEILNGSVPKQPNSKSNEQIMQMVNKYLPIVLGVLLFVVIVFSISSAIKKAKNERIYNNTNTNKEVKVKKEKKKKKEKEELIEEDNNNISPGDTVVDLNYTSNNNNESLPNDSSLVNNDTNTNNTTNKEGESELMDLFK